MTGKNFTVKDCTVFLMLLNFNAFLPANEKINLHIKSFVI